MSAPQPVPIAEILVVMTSSAYAQEDINNWLFAPDRKALGSTALGLLKPGSAPRNWRATRAVPVHRHSESQPALRGVEAGGQRRCRVRGRGREASPHVAGVENTKGSISEGSHRVTFSGTQFWDRICFLELDCLVEKAKTKAGLPSLSLFPPWQNGSNYSTSSVEREESMI